jgi:hypothetical protein
MVGEQAPAHRLDRPPGSVGLVDLDEIERTDLCTLPAVDAEARVVDRLSERSRDVVRRAQREHRDRDVEVSRRHEHLGDGAISSGGDDEICGLPQRRTPTRCADVDVAHPAAAPATQERTRRWRMA